MKPNRKLAAIILAIALLTALFTGCTGQSPAPPTSESAAQSNSKADSTPAPSAESVTLQYWTWFPNEDQLIPVVKAFEAANPDIKIELNVMESKAYQEKLPVALSTNEDIDVIGVQPSAMVGQIKTYLADLDPIMQQVVGADWQSKVYPADIDACKILTGGPLSIMPLFRSGAMIGYYNAAMLDEWGLSVPKTIEEYRDFAEQVRAKDSSVLPAVYAGKEAWVNDEMMLDVLGQSGNYYNKFRYDNASVDSTEFIDAFNGLKKFFDYNIFTMDIMDLDYGRAYEMFSTGKAATFYQGTWEASILSEKIRAENGIELTDVGVMALPIVKAGDKATLRSFLDCTVAIVENSQKKEAAAKWVEFLAMGDGVDIWANQFCGTPSKKGFVMDSSLLATKAEQDGIALLNELVATATADRNNVSGYSDIEGASVQKVVSGLASAEDEVKTLQQEWSSGKYGG